MAKCDFCNETISAGTGKKYILKDGKIYNFCSSKCQKHTIKLKHKGRTTRWSGHYHAEKKQEATKKVKKRTK